MAKRRATGLALPTQKILGQRLEIPIKLEPLSRSVNKLFKPSQIRRLIAPRIYKLLKQLDSTLKQRAGSGIILGFQSLDKYQIIRALGDSAIQHKLPPVDVLDEVILSIAELVSVTVSRGNSYTGGLIKVKLPSINKIIAQISQSEFSIVPMYDAFLGTTIGVNWIEWFIYGTQRAYPDNVAPRGAYFVTEKAKEQILAELLKRYQPLEATQKLKSIVNRIKSPVDLARAVKFEELVSPVGHKFRGVPKDNFFTQGIEASQPFVREAVIQEVAKSLEPVIVGGRVYDPTGSPSLG